MIDIFLWLFAAVGLGGVVAFGVCKAHDAHEAKKIAHDDMMNEIRAARNKADENEFILAGFKNDLDEITRRLIALEQAESERDDAKTAALAEAQAKSNKMDEGIENILAYEAKQFGILGGDKK